MGLNMKVPGILVQTGGRALWRSSLAFGSSRIASPAYQERPTESPPFARMRGGPAGAPAASYRFGV